MSESLHTVSTLLKQDRDRQRAEELCGSWMSTNDIKDSIQGGFSMPDVGIRPSFKQQAHTEIAIRNVRAR